MFKFDNMYSWTRSKEVFYSIQVLPPNTNPDLHDMSGVDRDQECGNGPVTGVAGVSTATEDNSDNEFYDFENDT